MASTRAQLEALIQSIVITGGRKTTAVNMRALLSEISISLLNILDNKNQANGYAGLDANGLITTSRLADASPTGKFLRDDGTFQTVAGGTTFAEYTNNNFSGTSINVGVTILELHGVYSFGQRLVKGVDFNLSFGTITFIGATSPRTNDVINITYRY